MEVNENAGYYGDWVNCPYVGYRRIDYCIENAWAGLSGFYYPRLYAAVIHDYEN